MDLEPIDNSVVDPTTLRYPNHTVFTHLGCALIRLSLGAAILTKQFASKESDNINIHINESDDIFKKTYHKIKPHLTKHTFLVILILSLIILFFIKRLNMKKYDIYWKSYIRMLLAYSMTLFMIIRKDYSTAGMLVMIDALMGVDSRHSASVATYICK